MSNNQAVVKHSTTSLVQLTKQKDIYLQAATALQNKGELYAIEKVDQLLAASYQPKFGDMKLAGQDGEDLLNLVASWRMQLGLGKNTSPQELAVEANYLIQNWPQFSMMDVNNAIVLFSKQKLDLKITYIPAFSTLIMGQILEAYDRYKKPVVSKVVQFAEEQQRLSQIDQEQLPKDRANTMKDIVGLCHQHMVDGWKETFFNRMVYDFLRRTKRLVFTEAEVKEAREYAQKKFYKWSTSKDGDVKAWITGDASKMDAKQKEEKLRQFGVEHCLSIFFAKNELKKVIDSITEKDYEK